MKDFINFAKIRNSMEIDEVLQFLWGKCIENVMVFKKVSPSYPPFAKGDDSLYFF